MSDTAAPHAHPAHHAAAKAAAPAVDPNNTKDATTTTETVPWAKRFHEAEARLGWQPATGLVRGAPARHPDNPDIFACKVEIRAVPFVEGVEPTAILKTFYKEYLAVMESPDLAKAAP